MLIGRDGLTHLVPNRSLFTPFDRLYGCTRAPLNSDYRLENLYLCLYWVAQYPRDTSGERRNKCFVLRLATLLRHNRNEPAFIWARMMRMTEASLIEKFSAIASNGVRSSHAISTIRQLALAKVIYSLRQRHFLSIERFRLRAKSLFVSD